MNVDEPSIEHRRGVKRRYDEIASRYENRYIGTTGEYFEDLEADYVFDLVTVSGSRVLDLGTGTGRFALRSICDEDAESVVGIDISDKMIEFARSSAQKSSDTKKKLSFVVMDGFQLGFSEDSFDVVISIGTFEYIKDLRPLLSELERVLKPTGMLVFTVHNEKRFVPRFKSENQGYGIAEHTLTSIKSQLDTSGFKFESYHGTFFANELFWLGHGGLGLLPTSIPQRMFTKAAISMQRFLNLFEWTRCRSGSFVVSAKLDV